MYGSDPKLKVVTWEEFVAAGATDEYWTMAHLIQNGFSK